MTPPLMDHLSWSSLTPNTETARLVESFLTRSDYSRMPFAVLGFLPNGFGIEPPTEPIEYVCGWWRNDDDKSVLVAVAVIHYRQERTMYLQEVCVAPKYRRKGILTNLIQWLRERVATNGGDDNTIELHLPTPDAVVLRSVYTKLGFVQINDVSNTLMSLKMDSLERMK